MKTYTAAAVAKHFLLLASKDPDHIQDISNMKLQKLVFFAQLCSLCSYDGIAIHLNNTHAWDYGPVVPALYKKLKPFGRQFFTLSNPAMSALFENEEPIEDEQALEILKSVWDKFKMWTSVQLSALTHRKNSPWSIVYNSNRYGVIPLELIKARKFGDA